MKVQHALDIFICELQQELGGVLSCDTVILIYSGETLLIHKKNTTIKLVYNWKLVGVVENVHCSNLKEISSSEGSRED